jgi:hypothetical protein
MFKSIAVNLIILEMCGRMQANALRSISGIDREVDLASGFSHIVAALSIGAWFYRPGIPKRVWLAGAICSVVPDLDVVGFRFGIRYGDFWGHRGFTHSLLFAALRCLGLDPGFSTAAAQHEPSLDLELFVSSRSEPWFSGRHDRQRAGSRILLSIQQ